jgi:hydroxymethylpyrimidine/phosphomethylpyrimidine kinase
MQTNTALNHNKPPNVLSIAGVDPSGGAGVTADIKTISALGAYACGVVTALTAQNTQAVTGIFGISPAFIAQQIDTLYADVAIAACKIGMLGDVATTRTVADRLIHWRQANIVLDPVMVAKSGDALLSKEAVSTLREALLPIAHVITPNLPEGGVLLACSSPETVKDMRVMAEKLRNLLNLSSERWVYLKGGHLPSTGDGLCTDLLHNGDVMIELKSPRINTQNTHGTGCALSSAIAALIPQRANTPDAARSAHAWLAKAIASSDLLSVGSGHGPVHHMQGLSRAQSYGQAH